MSTKLIVGILIEEYLLLLVEYYDKTSGLLDYQNLWDFAIVIML